ncbi:hypothetical protein TNCV_3317861 [Trichonephila clavipes]|nr:hypothetical protein TNCV_3317861 [Trichonephila clavipes]
MGAEDLHAPLALADRNLQPENPAFPGHLRHGDTLNTRQATSPLMRLVEGEERWEAPDHRKGILPKNLGGTEPKRTFT